MRMLFGCKILTPSCGRPSTVFVPLCIAIPQHGCRYGMPCPRPTVLPSGQWPLARAESRCAQPLFQLLQVAGLHAGAALCALYPGRLAVGTSSSASLGVRSGSARVCPNASCDIPCFRNSTVLTPCTALNIVAAGEEEPCSVNDGLDRRYYLSIRSTLCR